MLINTIIINMIVVAVTTHLDYYTLISENISTPEMVCTTVVNLHCGTGDSLMSWIIEPLVPFLPPSLSLFRNTKKPKDF